MVALETLKEVLLTLTKILAPFMPFIAETLYQELKSVLNKDKYEWKESVHLEDWPAKDKAPVDQGLIEEMQRIRDIAELAHSARAEAKIKVRQPLSQLVIASEFKEEFSDILQDELNVKEVTKLHQKHDGKLPGGSDWIKKDETEIKISLDITLTDELVEEGILREIVRQINSVRKKAGLTIQDRIAVYYQTDSEYLKKFFEFFESNLLKETLAISVQEYDKKKKAKFEKVVNVNGKLITVGIEKKS
jgi:isoleucyl-tRNA synthetase